MHSAVKITIVSHTWKRKKQISNSFFLYISNNKTLTAKSQVLYYPLKVGESERERERNVTDFEKKKKKTPTFL